jgi:hypothetical protein
MRAPNESPRGGLSSSSPIAYRIALADIFRPRARVSPPANPKATVMDTLRQDVRFAGRVLIKNRVFSAIAVLTLGLGIGANVSIFSLIYGLFIRPLPYYEPARLVRLWEQSADGRLTRLHASVPRFEHIRDRQQSFSAIAADFRLTMSLTGAGEPVRVIATAVTSNYFRVLGVSPMMGRSFRLEEEDRGQVAVVTHVFWTKRLHSDRSVLGRAIVLDATPYTIVGVITSMPLSDVGATEVFLPRPSALCDCTSCSPRRAGGSTGDRSRTPRSTCGSRSRLHNDPVQYFAMPGSVVPPQRFRRRETERAPESCVPGTCPCESPAVPARLSCNSCYFVGTSAQVRGDLGAPAPWSALEDVRVVEHANRPRGTQLDQAFCVPRPRA